MTQNILTAGNATSSQSIAAGDDGTFKIVVGPNGSQVDGISVDATGNTTVVGGVLSKGTSGLGYGTGAGGTVTQLTSKSTAVTINKTSGRITMNAASLAASTAVEFTVNNSLVGVDDLVLVTTQAGFSGYRVSPIKVGAGSFVIELINFTGGALAESVQVKFAIIKGATS